MHSKQLTSLKDKFNGRDLSVFLPVDLRKRASFLRENLLDLDALEDRHLHGGSSCRMLESFMNMEKGKIFRP